MARLLERKTERRLLEKKERKGDRIYGKESLYLKSRKMKKEQLRK